MVEFSLHSLSPRKIASNISPIVSYVCLTYFHTCTFETLQDYLLSKRFIHPIARLQPHIEYPGPHSTAIQGSYYDDKLRH